MTILVLGSPEDLELAGPPTGPSEPSSGALSAYITVKAPLDAKTRLAVALRDPSLLDGVQAQNRAVWLANDAAPPPPPGLPLIAQSGDALWRCAPWPATDSLFELDPPAHRAGFLIAGGTPERRERLAEQLRTRGHEGSAEERLTLADLRAASAVALLTAAPGGPLPATAPAVAAAGRILVADSYEPAFGFQPELDFLPATDDASLTEALDAALTAPAAFAAMRTLAAHAARAHRASEVYARLLADGDARNSSSAAST